MERKEKERERRLQMKELCFNLASLIPSSSSNSNSNSNSKVQFNSITQQDCLAEAATFISQVQGRIARLKQIRADFKNNSTIRSGTKRLAGAVAGSNKAVPPLIEVRTTEATNLEVILVSLRYRRLELHRVIGILDEEGADVKNANVSVVGDQVFYTIHAQALSSRIGVEASRVLERLRDLCE